MDFTSISMAIGVILNILIIIPMLFFLRNTLTPKRGVWGSWPACFMVMLVVTFLPSPIYFNYVLKLVIVIPTWWVALFANFTDRPVRKLLIACINLVILLAGELAATCFVWIKFEGEVAAALHSSPSVTFTYAGICTFTCCCLYVLSTKLLTRKSTDIPGITLLKFSVLPASQIAITFALSVLLGNKRALGGPEIGVTLIIFVVISSLVADFFIFDTLCKTAKNAQLEMKNQYLEEERRLQLEHYTALIAHQHTVRKMRHDIINHIQTIKTLLDQNENQLAQACNDQLMERYTAVATVDYCQHRVVDAVLHNKVEYAHAHEIRTSIQVSADEALPFDELDLMCLFSNLLDNAITACLRVPEQEQRFIEVRAMPQNDYYVICVRNTMPLQPTATNASQKHNVHVHGMGLVILRELAQKYGGQFTTEVHDNIFEAVATLCMGISENSVEPNTPS